jgi:O-antigen ligase
LTSQAKDRILGIALAVFIGAYYVLPLEGLHKGLFYALVAASVFWLIPPSFWKFFFVSRFTLICFFYATFQFTSSFWRENIDGEELFEIVRKSFLILLFLGITARAIQQRQFHLMTLLALILAGALGALAHYGIPQGENAARLVDIGRGDNPVQSGALFGLAVIIALYSVLQASLPGPHKWVAVTCLLLALMALILTQSRGAWLACAAALGAFFVLVKCSPRQRLLLLLLGIFALLAGVTLINPADIFARADAFRFAIWQDVFTRSAEHPWLGWGYRTPYSYLLPYGESIYQPHGIYITALFYGGATGLALLLMLLLQSLSDAWKHRQETALPLLLLINSLVFGLFDFSLLITSVQLEWLVFWWPIGILIGLSLREPVRA